MSDQGGRKYSKSVLKSGESASRLAQPDRYFSHWPRNPPNARLAEEARIVTSFTPNGIDPASFEAGFFLPGVLAGLIQLALARLLICRS